MPRVEQSGVFRPTTQPVLLPSDERPVHHRRLATWIAVLVLLVGVGGGLLYKVLWKDVGHEITRLLPASSPLFIHSTQPSLRLEAAMALDRWRDPGALRRIRRSDGVLAEGLRGRIAGLPLAAIRRALLTVSSLQVAVVPTARGDATLAILSFEDPRNRRYLVSELEPHLETIDRQLGFDVRGVRAGPGWTPWSAARWPIRIIEMDGRLVVSFGPELALEDLMQARVAGRSQPIRRREGFDVNAAITDRSGLWAYVDTRLVLGALAGTDGPSELGRWLAHLEDMLGPMTLRNGLFHGDDRLDVRIPFRLRDPDQPGGRTVVGGDHSLLRRMPLDAGLMLSISLRPGDDGVHPLDRLAGLDPVEDEDGPAALMERVAAQVASWIGASPEGRPSQALSGDVLLALLPKAGPSKAGPWAVVAGLRDPNAAARMVQGLIDSLLDSSWSQGTVYGDATPLHVVRRAADASLDVPFSGFLWQVTGDVLVAASDPALLDRMGSLHDGPGAGGDEAALGMAVRNLPTRHPIIVMASPSFAATHARDLARSRATGKTPHPLGWSDLVLDQLTGDFRLAATMGFEPDAIHIHGNLGLWTVLAALSAWDLLTLDGHAMDGVPERCRQAYLELCERAYGGPLCEPFQPDRDALVRKACRRLGLEK